jgi:hypothetical protein
MIEPIETIACANGNTIKVFTDEEPQSPREWDNAGTMVCFHRRYNLGDKTDLESDNFNSWNEAREYLVKENDAVVILPLYLYDHSGLTMATTPFSCPWDSGQVGFIYISRAKAVAEWGNKVCTAKVKEMAAKCLQAEVETYDEYLRGEVYGYVIEDKDGNQIGSCWDFYGKDDMIAEAKAIAEQELATC